MTVRRNNNNIEGKDTGDMIYSLAAIDRRTESLKHGRVPMAATRLIPTRPAGLGHLFTATKEDFSFPFSHAFQSPNEFRHVVKARKKNETVQPL